MTFLGDGYNMCHSYINAAKQWNFKLRFSCPDSISLTPIFWPTARTSSACLTAKPWKAHLVVTDVWSSMGHEGEEGDRRIFLSHIRSMKLCSIWPTPALCSCTAASPPRRGSQNTLLDDPRSVVFHEAGNRLHSQKALVEFYCWAVRTDPRRGFERQPVRIL